MGVSYSSDWEFSEEGGEILFRVESLWLGEWVPPRLDVQDLVKIGG